MTEPLDPSDRPDPRARRAAVLRARRRRRRLVLGAGWLLAAGAFALTLLILLPDAWPEIPFPKQRVIVLVAIVGAVFGLVIGSWKAIGLSIVLLPVCSALAKGGIFSGIFALLVAGPYAAGGLIVGVGFARGSRALVRRLRTADGRRERRHASTTEAPTPAG